MSDAPRGRRRQGARRRDHDRGSPAGHARRSAVTARARDDLRHVPDVEARDAGLRVPRARRRRPYASAASSTPTARAARAHKLRRTASSRPSSNEERATRRRGRRRAASRARRRARPAGRARADHAPAPTLVGGRPAARRGARRARRAGRAARRCRACSRRCAQEVTEGSSLADALAAASAASSPSLYVNMVRAGEASGALDVVLERLADYTESQARLLGKVRERAHLPGPSCCCSSATSSSSCSSYVVPEGDAHLRGDAPAAAAADRVSARRLRLRRAVVVAPAARDARRSRSASALARDAGRPRPRSTADARACPYFGRLAQKLAVARFARTLVDPARERHPAAAGARHREEHRRQHRARRARSRRARDAIREGQSIAPPLRESGLFPPLVVHMIAVGERSGELEAMLGKVADAYDDEVENAVGALTTILEPIIIVFMGGVVLVHRARDPAADLRAEPHREMRRRRAAFELRRRRRFH